MIGTVSASDMCERLIEGATYAESLMARYLDGAYSLHVMDTGIQCRAVHFVDGVKHTQTYLVNYEVMKHAYRNPLIEALDLCRRSILERE